MFFRYHLADYLAAVLSDRESVSLEEIVNRIAQRTGVRIRKGLNQLLANYEHQFGCSPLKCENRLYSLNREFYVRLRKIRSTLSPSESTANRRLFR